MRLWSIHPRYLDCIGLVSLWRESLLAQKVLTGKTERYRNHPQLERFRKHPDPIKAIGSYLFYVYDEGLARCYRFRRDRILHPVRRISPIRVSMEQILFEFDHLMKKMMRRDLERYRELSKIKKIEPHPIFEIVNGCVEDWERI